MRENSISKIKHEHYKPLARNNLLKYNQTRKGYKMRKLDLYWKTNRDWWEFKNHIPVVKDDAPLAAKESYQNYLKQVVQDDDD